MDIPDQIPNEGIHIPTRGVFASTGIFAAKARPGRLTLFDDRVELKVMKSASFRLDELSEVDARTMFMTNNVTFLQADTRRRPTANIKEKTTMRSLLLFLSRRGVTLTDRARALMVEEGG